VHYVITGGGGAPLYDVDTPPADIVKKVASTENFVVVRVNGRSAHLEAIKPNGEIVEATDVSQSGGLAVIPSCGEFRAVNLGLAFPTGS
jgi:hypothetical protein